MAEEKAAAMARAIALAAYGYSSASVILYGDFDDVGGDSSGGEDVEFYIDNLRIHRKTN